MLTDKILTRRERNILKNAIKKQLVMSAGGCFDRETGKLKHSEVNLTMVIKNVFDALHKNTAIDHEDKDAKPLYVDKWADLKNKPVVDPWADMRGSVQESDTPTNKRLVMTADGPVLIDDDEVTFQDER